MRFQVSHLAALLVSAAVFGCAPTNVQTDYQRNVALGRPERVLVYEFAFSPEQVQLDRGIGARVQQALQGTPPTVEEREIGRAVASTIAEQLVAQINAMGLPAERAYGAPQHWMHSVLIEGQLLSVDQGNRTRRVVIGLGAGHSDVDSEVQVYATRERGLEKLAEFSADARSGYKPGAAETLGAGAAAGAIGTAAAASAGTSVLSESLSATVQADAKRTADAIAAHLQQYFAQQGWIAPQ